MTAHKIDELYLTIQVKRRAPSRVACSVVGDAHSPCSAIVIVRVWRKRAWFTIPLPYDNVISGSFAVKIR